MKPTTELYYKYAGVITSVVNSYAWNCPKYIKDELQLQAELVFCEACLSYDPNHPSKASFETWLRNQLKSITRVISKAAHGPSLVKDGGQSVMTINMLARNISRKKDEDPLDISDTASKWYLNDYSDNLLKGLGDSEYPEEIYPYIKALNEDALQIFQDFCKGKFMLTPQKFMTIAKRKAREVLNPTRLYRRLYMQEGWSLERVRKAWKDLCSVISSYRMGTLPSHVYTSGSRTSNGPSETAKCTNRRYNDFEKRHKISYGSYRSLVKRGIIPKLSKGDKDLDLSIYAATSC